MSELEDVEEGVSEEMETSEEEVPVEEQTVIEEEPIVETYSQRSDGFVAFIRHEDKVLLMQRADGVADFPGAWDGVYGVGDSRDLDAVVTRVEQATGLSAANLTHVRSGKPRGVEMGNRLYDITPILFMSESTEIEPRTLYKSAEWIDPGSIQDKSYCVSQLGELYGDVSAYLYIVKTTIGQEEKVAREMKARLSGTGSLQDIQDEIYGVLYPTIMRGYIFVEASAFHHVEKLIGRAGGRTTPLKNCSRVLPGTAPLGDVTPYLEPKAATAGIEEGDIVEIRVGAFKGERARVTNIAETKEEVTVELFEAAVPIPITVRADQVRVTQRVD
ncbi:MAG: transcription elongation factor Spt5 [Candidatus Thermoplasmatota archaeon]|nr:transcription elongation factor Spt5 [Candidatus Thermoplasmatota archaeon]